MGTQRRRSDQEWCRVFLHNEHIIIEAAKETLGVAFGTTKTHTTRRESWWLREEVQSKLAVKQAMFRELLSCQE
ncbi:hypothetical protein Tco_0339154, partial [Tanacetum coccineum]